MKSKNGTWISLCEYETNSEGIITPIFALSAQIGNEDYKDCYGKILSENEYYILHNKQFTPIILDDGLFLIKISSKVKDNVEIIKCKNFNDDTITFCVRKEKLSSHGNTLKEAMSDLLFKEMKNRNIDEIVSEIKKSGFVTRNEYRCITGACQFGTEQFAKEHGYSNVDKVELNELLSKLDDSYYGAKTFKKLFI